MLGVCGLGCILGNRFAWNNVDSGTSVASCSIWDTELSVLEVLTTSPVFGSRCQFLNGL
jgi:hypothetical protein